MLHLGLGLGLHVGLGLGLGLIGRVWVIMARVRVRFCLGCSTKLDPWRL